MCDDGRGLLQSADAGTAARPGMAWSFELDLPALLADLGMPDSGAEEDQDALLAAEVAAMESAPASVGVPGRVAEALPAGPGLAAWLAGVRLPEAGDSDLPGLLAAFRRVASWAQARELEVAAQIASRCAAANPRVGVDESGRPAQLPPEAPAQVGLALGMSQFGASAWTGLGVQLGWQLPGTAAALADGLIDLGRARLIAEATAVLPDDVARVVEDRVLPAAGGQTNGQLRVSLRRAVIAADPEGADRRRQDSERNARVSLHPDADGTAALTGSSLPGAHAAAAMARISAMARALQTSGAGGGLDVLRAHIYLGLLLGTLPLIPPSADGPPDDGPPDDGPPGDAPPGDVAPDDVPRGDVARGDVARGDLAPGDAAAGGVARAGADPNAAASPSADWPDVPPPGDEDAPPDAGEGTGGPAWNGGFDDDDGDRWLSPPLAWPRLPGAILAAFGQGASRVPGRPPLGLLDVILPWPALAGGGCDPAVLGRIGPITRPQARELAWLGSTSPATRWRIILTDDHGCALAVEGFALPGPGPGGAAAGPATTAVVGRVSITIRASQARELSDSGSGPDAVLAAAARAAGRAAARLDAARAADAANGGRCAHTMGSAAYRPPPRLREFVAARDGTCRYRTCGQPAWRGDLDHTQPWHDGGITCSCDLGGLCRTHHKIKQLPGWRLEQLQPGQFRWTTPAGQICLVGPDPYPV